MKSKNQKVVVTTPINLKKNQVSQIKKGLENVLGGKNFSLEVHQNPNILGGIIVQIDSRVINLSLDEKLKQIGALLINV